MAALGLGADAEAAAEAPAAAAAAAARRAAAPVRHAELAETAAHINETHRQAKRAQKECSDLYLLLLLHKCEPAPCFKPSARKSNSCLYCFYRTLWHRTHPQTPYPRSRELNFDPVSAGCGKPGDE